MRTDDREIHHEEHDHHEERGGRPGGGDSEFLARRSRLPRHLREAPEQEQLDVSHLDAVASGDHSMAKLMHDQRRKEQQRAHHG